MNSISDLQLKILAGFDDWEELGDVRVIKNGDLLLFNYTRSAHFENRWNWLERVSRGLIMNGKTGEVGARSFDKFWGWNDRGRKSKGHITTVTEKVDGSLGILYRQGGKYHIATRGSFDGDQAYTATKILDDYYDLDDPDIMPLPEEYTLLFEIVYPENRVIVDYGSVEDLYLIAIRNRFTGDYLPFYPDVVEFAQAHCFLTPRVFDFTKVEDIMALLGNLDSNQEGFVAEFSDGERHKFKGNRYVEIHRFISSISYNKTVKAIADGTLKEMIGVIPEEFLGIVRDWEADIQHTVRVVQRGVDTAFSIAPKKNRKEFALFKKENYTSMTPYLF